MSIDDFLKEVESAADNYSLRFEILAKTKNAIKITENIYIRLYFNQESETRNYVLVGWNRRLFGRDCVGGKWYKHPFGNPDEREFSKNGKQEVLVTRSF